MTRCGSCSWRQTAPEKKRVCYGDVVVVVGWVCWDWVSSWVTGFVVEEEEGYGRDKGRREGGYGREREVDNVINEK